MLLFDNFKKNDLHNLNIKETYKLLLCKEENWKNYNSLFPFPNSNYILILYKLARKFQIDTINVHYATCLLQRYFGLREYNEKNRNTLVKKNVNFEIQMAICAFILSCKMNETQMDSSKSLFILISNYFERGTYVKMELEFLDIIKNYLRIPLLDEYVGLILEYYYPENIYLPRICQKIVDFIYCHPKEYLEESFTLVSICVVSISFAIHTKSNTKQVIRWASLVSDYPLPIITQMIDRIQMLIFKGNNVILSFLNNH